MKESTTLDKKENHPRDSRREERCSTCDIMLDQARSAQGKSRGQSLIGLAQRWSRLIEHDITRGTAFFSPRISMMVLFFVQGSTRFGLKLLFALFSGTWLDDRQIFLLDNILCSLSLSLSLSLSFFLPHRRAWEAAYTIDWHVLRVPNPDHITWSKVVQIPEVSSQ